MSFHLSSWDLVLMIVVTAQSTLLAYLSQPRLKALVLTLPLPFTLAVLSVGKPVGIANLMGLPLLVLYFQMVRLLHIRCGVPIVPAIFAAALGYCLMAALILPALPAGEFTFWITALLLYVLALALLRLLPARDEPAYRSPLPVWLKVPILLAVVFTIVALKSLLQGFMTLFPMVGVVASYEARHSLWTMARQIPVLMLAMIPMICATHLAQPALGVGWALAAGWVVFLPVLALVTQIQRGRLNTIDGRSSLHALKIFR